MTIVYGVILVAANKKVLLQILNHHRRCPADETVMTIKEQLMPIIEEAMHMGILRSADTEESAVTHNIQRARRTVYSWNQDCTAKMA